MPTCLNCENEFEGNFCNKCGQKAATHRFTMHEWLHEIPHSLFHVDGSFVTTIKTLTLRGGDAVREFLAGKRKTLFSPFLYVLVWCGVYLVVSHFFGSAEKAIDTPTNFAEAQAYIEAKYYKIIVVAMILPVAIGSYVVYFRSGYNFAEHLVLNAYLMGQLVIADVVLTLISATPLNARFPIAIKVIELVIKYPYWFWFYRRFFQTSKWYWAILQFIAALFIGGLALSVVIGLAALFVVKSAAPH